MAIVVRAAIVMMGGLGILSSAAIFLLAVSGRRRLMTRAENSGFRDRLIFTYIMCLAVVCVGACALVILNILYPGLFAIFFPGRL